MHKLKTRVLIILITLIAYACSDALYLAEGGIGGTGVSSGPVSGFGSIFVNGIKFDTSNTQISIEGTSATEDDLQLGMIVTVVGEINEQQTQGSATTITFNYTLQAEISRLDIQQKTITAGGKKIHIDELTVFFNTSMERLSPGDIIGVSGNIMANGEITAKYINPLIALPIASPTTGNADSITATMENLSNAIEQPDIDLKTVTLLGLISSRPTNQRLVIQGKEITIDASTVIINGGETDLSVDTTIEVSANVNDRGELSAKRIFIHRPASIHIEAAVDSINPGNASFVLAGITLHINASTLMQDSRNNIRRFSLKDLGVGDQLVVYGRKEGESIILTRLQRRDDLTETVLSGPIGNMIASPRFVLFGLAIETSNSRYSDAGGNSINTQTFFNQLREGVSVKATGTLSGTTLIATTVAIK